MRNIFLKIMYKGTNYSGWQKQDNFKTVQGCIEKAIFKVTSEEVNMIASGRTDAGVHALGQVANFMTKSKIEEDNFKNAINAYLDDDIRVVESKDIDIGFHSRFDAKEKTYIYLIDNSIIKNPFFSEFSSNVREKIDISRLKKEKESLIGKNDFTSFYKIEKDNPKNPIRNIKSIEIEEIYKNLIKIEISAESFLYNMVRIIVGTMVEVAIGKNKLSVKEILEKKDRKYAGKTFDAKGLILKEVKY